MFFNHLANRTKRGGDTNLGKLNSRRDHTKRVEILDMMNALREPVLEIGPGEGYIAEYCRDADIEYTGLERSLGLQAMLQELGYNVIAGAAPDLPFGSEQFNSVIFFNVLEHMPTFEEALRLLQESKRVLAPTGKVALEVPDFLRGGLDFYNWDYTHSFVTTPYRVKQILDDAGFEIEEITHFSGSLTGPLRLISDFAGFFVQTRAFYWLMSILGLEKWLYRYRKTVSPSFLVIATKAA